MEEAPLELSMTGQPDIYQVRRVEGEVLGRRNSTGKGMI